MPNPNDLLALFEQQIPIRGVMRLGMLAPLALSVSIVYKTIHCRNISHIPLDSLKLCVTILAGMLSIGVALLLLFRWLA